MCLICVPSTAGQAKGSAQVSGFTAAPPSYRHLARRKELSEVLPGGTQAPCCTPGGQVKTLPRQPVDSTLQPWVRSTGHQPAILFLSSPRLWILKR